MSRKDPSNWSRRQFLAAAAAGTGYNLIVKAPQSLVAAPDPMERAGATEELVQYGEQFHPLAPEDAPKADAEPNMHKVELEADVVVCGGGMTGICAAIAAARHGTKVILVQDRSRLGGNASSEVGMHIRGADRHSGWREGGILEELRLENSKWNPHSAWELWDFILYDKCVSEPNLKLILDTSIYRAEMKDENTIEAIWARCDRTEHLYPITAPLFVDATGDSRLGLESGAAYRVGREAPSEFDEDLAGYYKTGAVMGSSVLFTAREHDRPIPYRPPSWARKLSAEHFQYRGIGSYEYGYWWIELGGVYDTIRDNERLRFELLALLHGIWDFIKNSGEHPDSENWALQTVTMLPGKRESRRIEGDVMMTQHDLEGDWRNYHDGVAIGGWSFDDHPSLGFDANDEPPNRSVSVDPYNIVFGSLYSRNIHNLFMVGRNISVSHVAFSSTRVMGTCAVAGQAVGTAAVICLEEGIRPHELRQDIGKVRRLQQRLLRDDQTIRDVTNEDPNDLARRAEVSASSVLMDGKPEYVINGVTRDMPGEVKNRWMGDMEADEAPWIELTWDEPETIGHVQLVFDSGFQRVLTMTSNLSFRDRMTLGPQPETVRDYTLTAVKPNGDEVSLAEVEDNYQRLCRHTFDPVEVEALRLTVQATNGEPEARVYEIRCYEEK